MYIHGPEETVDLVTVGQLASNGFFLQMYLTASSLFSSDSAKELTIQQRKCRFIHESNLRHSPVYSYNLCRMECRIHLCLKKCKCIPHWYRPRGTYFKIKLNLDKQEKIILRYKDFELY